MTALFATLFVITLISSICLLVVLKRRHRIEIARKSEDKAALLSSKAALQEQVERAIDQRAKLLDALGDAFLLVEDESIIRVFNEKAKTLFDGRELQDRSLNEVVLDGRLLNVLNDSLKNSEGNPRRVMIRLPEGHPARDGVQQAEVTLEIDTAPFSRSMHLKRISIRNVTQSHITEQVRKDFVANASHELRTPLAIINGYLENLIDDDLVSEPKLARKFLKTMRKHSTRIARIIEDMLVISKLESGEVSTLKIKPFKVKNCIQDVVERLQHMIDETGTQVEVEVSDSSLSFEGDRFYWTQIIFNLVENAIKQNPGSGLKVRVGAQSEGDKIHLWISDDGVGIPSSHLPFIFKRFYRVETHHSQEIRGTGLGLSIVKRGIEAHHGTIEVSSTPGVDTRFDIRVPREQPKQDFDFNEESAETTADLAK